MTKTLSQIGGCASSCYLPTERAKFAIQNGKGGSEICATHRQAILTLRPLLPHPFPDARLAADSKIETDGVANLILLIGPLQAAPLARMASLTALHCAVRCSSEAKCLIPSEFPIMCNIWVLHHVLTGLFQRVLVA
jgi:hypothetical protein